MKTIMSALILILSSMTHAAEPMAPDIELNCSDRTFNYHKLELKTDSSNVSFVASGGSSLAVEHLRKVKVALPNIGNFKLNVKSPLEQCMVSSADNRVFTCYGVETKVDIEIDAFRSSHSEVLKIEHPKIKMRKITALSQFGEEIQGFELSIEGTLNDLPNPLFVQRYFYDLGGDQSDYCELIEGGVK